MRTSERWRTGGPLFTPALFATANNSRLCSSPTQKRNVLHMPARSVSPSIEFVKLSVSRAIYILSTPARHTDGEIAIVGKALPISFPSKETFLADLAEWGKAVVIGYATAAAFASQAYLDEYWCMIFIFDAARRLVARKVAVQPAASSGAARMRLRGVQQPIGSAGLVRPIDRLGHAKRPS